MSDAELWARMLMPLVFIVGGILVGFVVGRFTR